MEEQEGRRMIQVVRWLSVLPAAILGAWIGGVLGGIAIVLRQPHFPEFLFPFFFLLPAGFGLVAVGGWVAPRSKLLVAAVLAIVCCGVSWTIHVLLQSEPGRFNYLHAMGESVGAVLGVMAQKGVGGAKRSARRREDC